MSDYDDLLKHVADFNRFASIPGHKHGKIKSPEPEKPEKPEQDTFAEVDFEGKPVKK